MRHKRMYAPAVEGKCDTCGNELSGRQLKYCCQECQWAGRRKRISLTCQVCGNHFETHECRTNAKYCSYKCYWEAVTIEAEESVRIRQSNAMRIWKKDVLVAGGYKCKICGSAAMLRCHHIIPFAIDKSLQLDVSNGMVLCNKCHKAIHIEMNNSMQRDIFYVQTCANKWKDEL